MKTAVMLLALLAAPLVFAQGQTSPNQSSFDQPANNMQVLEQAVQANRKLVLAGNMNLTQGEANRFWPIYDRYINHLKKPNQKTLALINSYASYYNAGTLTDHEAGKLIHEMLSLKAADVKLEESYAADLGKVLPEKKVARALQIENKLRAIVMYHLAEQIPLVQ